MNEWINEYIVRIHSTDKALWDFALKVEKQTSSVCTICCPRLACRQSAKLLRWNSKALAQLKAKQILKKKYYTINISWMNGVVLSHFDHRFCSTLTIGVGGCKRRIKAVHQGMDPLSKDLDWRHIIFITPKTIYFLSKCIHFALYQGQRNRYHLFHKMI